MIDELINPDIAVANIAPIAPYIGINIKFNIILNNSPTNDDGKRQRSFSENTICGLAIIEIDELINIYVIIAGIKNILEQKSSVVNSIIASSEKIHNDIEIRLIRITIWKCRSTTFFLLVIFPTSALDMK